VAGDAASTAAAVHDNAQSLAQLAEELDTMVGKFNI
jgi:methyl-accepting chemotaxis protein